MWFLVLLFLFASPVRAQDASPTPYLFTQYSQDYLYQYSLYQQAYLDYTNKKDVYTKYGTITTQKDKLVATINTLKARNVALKSYLVALRTLLNDYKAVNPTTTEKTQIDLSKWESWCDEQATVIPALNNDADVAKWAGDFKVKYVLIQRVIYAALVQHEVNLRQLGLNQAQSIANDIKNNPKIQPESQQWISTLAVKSDLVSSSLTNAVNLSQKNQNQNKFSNFYPEARLEMGKAQDYLVEIIGDLKLTVTKFYRP